MTSPLPENFTLKFDPALRTYADGTVLLGGSPYRLMRISTQAVPIIQAWQRGEPVGRHGDLARRFTQAGIAEPVPPAPPRTPAAPARISVVVPVLNNASGLDRLLQHLVSIPVIVVDDVSGPMQHNAIAELCESRDVTLITHVTNRGPAAARNTGWHASSTSTDFVCFIDSDAIVDSENIRRLAAHFADPDVVAAAPRIVAFSTNTASTATQRYENRHSPLDIGDRAAHVAALTRVAYVPSTCLIVTKAALAQTQGFDESMRFGEDVDLVWRLGQIGSVRYDPEATVQHEHPATLAALVKRRIGYGSSAAALTKRHPKNVAPANCSAYTAAAWAAIATGHPIVAAATMAATAAQLPKKLTDVPKNDAIKLAMTGHLKAWQMFTSATRRAWLPLILVAAIRSKHARRWLLLSLITVKPLKAIDDVAYCVGVYKGCWQEKSLAAIVPKFSQWPPRRDAGPATSGDQSAPPRQIAVDSTTKNEP